jgi:beta-lactam-binding protein with PASTA domain
VVTMNHARSVTAKFTRAPCVVPKLRGEVLDAAKRALLKAHCKPGRITNMYSRVVRRGRVISQKPKSGTHSPPGAKVNLVISKGKKSAASAPSP